MNAEGIEHRLEIVEMAERLIRAFGLAIAAPVIGNGMPAVVGDDLHLLGPHALVANTGMEEDDRQPLPHLDAGEAGPADLDGEILAYHAQSSASVASLTQQARSALERI